jgi:hypothetical protein
VVSADTLALRVLALTELGKRVETARTEAKRQLAGLLTPGDSKKPGLPGAQRLKLGSVSYTTGRVTASVTDPDAFAAWVTEHQPDAADLVVRVKPWFEKAVLDASAAAGEPCTPDGTLDVPGIEVGSAAPYISTRTNPNLSDDLWRLLIDGDVPGLALAELTGGEQS